MEFLQRCVVGYFENDLGHAARQPRCPGSWRGLQERGYGGVGDLRSQFALGHTQLSIDNKDLPELLDGHVLKDRELWLTGPMHPVLSVSNAYEILAAVWHIRAINDRFADYSCPTNVEHVSSTLEPVDRLEVAGNMSKRPRQEALFDVRPLFAKGRFPRFAPTQGRR